MDKRKKQPRKPKATQRTTAKKVQQSENLPPPVPTVQVKPEVDNEPWDVDGLTLRQRLFAEYYLGRAGGNATKAAELAGYASDNNIALRVTAHRTLTNANVQRLIAREIGKRFGSPEDVRNGIAGIANGNAADYLELDEQTGKLRTSLDRMAETGSLALLHELREEGVEAAGSITIVKRKLKLYDKLKALELLARMNGQLVDRRDVTSNGETIKGYAVVSPDDWDKPTNPDASGGRGA